MSAERYRVAVGVGCRVRRDLELDEAVTCDLGEGRRGDDAAPDRAVRLVDRDEHDEPRILRRHDADERGDVARGRVAAALGLRGGARLAGDGVARHCGGRAGAALGRDDVAQHRHHLRRDGLGDDALAGPSRLRHSVPTRSTRYGVRRTPPFAIAAYAAAIWIGVTPMPWPIGTLPIVEPDQ